MAYDEPLADRIRRILADRTGVSERTMFGGLAFLFNGRMCCGIVGPDLMVRVPVEDFDAVLQKPHVRPMDFSDRPLRGFVYVSPEGLTTARALRHWLSHGERVARALGVRPADGTRRSIGNLSPRPDIKGSMTEPYAIALAEPRHLGVLDDIELAAAQLLHGHAPRRVLKETTLPGVLATAMRRGHLWVALHAASPVGFALVEMLASDHPHLAEIAVHPAHGRRGLGTCLVRAVCEWAAVAGYAQVTLTTFRHVPWNMPWYTRLGFVELPPQDWPDEVSRQVASETARGLDPVRRVVLTYRCHK